MAFPWFLSFYLFDDKYLCWSTWEREFTWRGNINKSWSCPGFEPQTPVWQVSALSITPYPSSHNCNFYKSQNTILKKVVAYSLRTFVICHCQVFSIYNSIKLDLDQVWKESIKNAIKAQRKKKSKARGFFLRLKYEYFEIQNQFSWSWLRKLESSTKCPNIGSQIVGHVIGWNWGT